MRYEMWALSDRLIFIRWYSTTARDTASSEAAFLAAMQQALEAAPGRVYFLSDLRQAHITSPRTLWKLGQMTLHPHWGGGIAYGQRMSTGMYVETFEKLSLKKNNDHMVYSVAEALAYLETLSPGITDGVDEALLLSNDSLNSDNS
ncbi:MAG: hypothetical protein MUE40_00925 [Anaerolineae bacterium]|jgi:hypothetical protein|nr:hypothetical protein [Anaerolineae bacterium]